ncbi:MAG: NAD(P)H-dependent glycerol-3-phosphate dehydrogenase [Pseudomonadota bacterium]
MRNIAILGAGAFGTALAIAMSRSGRRVTLWARDANLAKDMQRSRRSGPRLPDLDLPETLSVTGDLGGVETEVVLICVPMSSLPELLQRPDLRTPDVFVACMKGIDPHTQLTPTAIIQAARPGAEVAALTGPSFAADIAQSLPTAVTLACANESLGADLQRLLSGQTLRLYRTTDVVGAELGGAIKNVVALAAGVAIGAGLGESARASVIARGMAEMMRITEHLGGAPSTMSGLSGLGDLVLTATSEKSRNYRAGIALGAGAPLPAETTEGLATARALSDIAARLGIEAPIAKTITGLIDKTMTVEDAITDVLARPLRKE